MISALFLFLTFANCAKAVVPFGNQWYEYWEEYHDYIDELGGPENVSSTVRLVNSSIKLTSH